MRRVVFVLVAAGLASAGLMLTEHALNAHAVPSPCDFTTGGGFVFKVTTGGRVNFGIVGGCKNEGFYGHVNVVDHETGRHINGPVTAYFDPLFADRRYRDLCGIDRNSGERFRVRTLDNGEPGGDDRFGVQTTDGYVVRVTELGPPGRTGGGGNIQLHKGNPSNTGPDDPPSDIEECGVDDGRLGM